MLNDVPGLPPTTQRLAANQVCEIYCSNKRTKGSPEDSTGLSSEQNQFITSV